MVVFGKMSSCASESWEVEVVGVAGTVRGSVNRMSSRY